MVWKLKKGCLEKEWIFVEKTKEENSKTFPTEGEAQFGQEVASRQRSS